MRIENTSSGLRIEGSECGDWKLTDTHTGSVYVIKSVQVKLLIQVMDAAFGGVL